jgi:NAD(P)-dependent dehydrogenase (short-subunit alcohol dehydrogenase family)
MSDLYRARPADGIAWVTGASSGIGRATVLELVRRGWTVAATARRRPELDRLAAEASGPGRVIAVEGDVTDEAAMQAAVDRAEAASGPVVLAFLNAGIYEPTRAVPFEPRVFRKTFDVNVMGTVNALAAVLPRMAGRGRGQLAINASVAGYGGLPLAAAYGATKAALINMAAALKFDLDPRDIRLQVVNPGFVETAATAINDHPMPFIIPDAEAARRICDGFERAGFEIAFPRRFAFLLKLVNALPYALYFPVVRAMTGAGRKPKPGRDAPG